MDLLEKGAGNESNNEFDMQKAKSLSGIDNSKKGSIDEYISGLVSIINNSNEFFTTSSCSGRLALISEGDVKKKGCNWLYMSHTETSSPNIIKALQERGDVSTVTFKYESFVLHAQCRTLEKAQQMLQIALQAGFRNSGLVIGRKKRIMLAVRSTHSMEIPLVLNGTLMVTEEYITKIIEISNEKLKENFRRIDRFFDGLKSTISA